MIEGDTALGDTWVQTLVGKLALAPGSSKKTSFILESFQLDHKGPFELDLGKNHKNDQ